MSNNLKRIALLGAECTGKTTLSLALFQTLQWHGLETVLISETLRLWCEQKGRTPQMHEQFEIAKAQSEQIFAVQKGWVIADTSALMTAVYSDYFFNDQTLYDAALAQQAQFDLTLVMGLDLAWQADGLQRDGAHVREPVDSLIREALGKAQVPFKVIYGQGDSRLNAALLAINESLRPNTLASLQVSNLNAAIAEREDSQYGLNRGKTAWRCERCSDADCEHQLFTRLIDQKGQ
jgi:nicotinamide riboside kinase